MYYCILLDKAIFHFDNTLFMKKYILLSFLVLTFSLSRAQTITMDSFAGSYCVGQSFYVYIQTTGTFPNGNYFIAEISDNFGNFYGIYLTGTIYGSPDSILVTIPTQYGLSGGGYRIRVRNDGGGGTFYSNTNGYDLTIYTLPPAATLAVSGNGCAGVDSLTALGATGGTLFGWSLNGNSVSSTADSSYIPQAPGSYTVSYVSSVATGSCVSPASNAVTINPTATAVTIAISGSVCYGLANTYTANSTNGGSNPTYQWYEGTTAVGSDTAAYTNSNAHSTDSIRVVMTSNAVCASGTQTSATVPAAVYVVPSAPLLSASGHGCLGTDSLAIAATVPVGVTWYYGGVAIDSSLEAYTVAGGNGHGNAADQFIYPYDAFVDGTGNIYVSDLATQRVKKFPAGSTSLTNGVTVAQNGIGVPLSVWVDGSGNLYVGDPGLGFVLKYPAGSDSTTAGIIVAGDPWAGTYNGPNQLNAPVSIYIDGTGNLYVGDDGNDRVQKFPPGSDSLTNAVTVAKNGIGSVNAIYLDHSGNVYVADYTNNCVWKFPAGADSTTAGTIVAHHMLNYPSSVYVDGSGNVYVADQRNNRIQMFPAGSDSSTVGVTVAGGLTGGSGINQLSNPSSVYIYGGDLYITDANNARVQKWVPGAPVTTYLPSAAGSYTATYLSVNGCPSPLSDTVLISAPPVVSLSWNLLVLADFLQVEFGQGQGITWCWDNNPIIPMAGGFPFGGTYSGIGISNDTLKYSNADSSHFEEMVSYTYTDSIGCSAVAIDSFPAEECLLGIKPIPGEATISLYPNPNNGSFVLQSSDAVGQEYIITDMLGRVVDEATITSGDQNINLGNISAGSYMLSIKGNNSKAVRFSVE